MDDTNEDSWLYGTSNPDSTTNEVQNDGVGTSENKAASEQSIKTDAENEAQALAAIQGGSDLLTETKEEEPDEHEVGESYGDFEDPAHEMEEDEEAVVAAREDVDSTDNVASGRDGDADDEGQPQTKASDDDEDDDEDEDDSDDDINVVIGDIKAAPSTYNIKQRGNLLAPGQAGQDKTKGASQSGKFTVEDFEGVGTINGVPAHEFSIDSLEDKPWRKPGADITDYFNYGFNEETWRAYCERQKRFRVVESGVGLASLTQNLNQSMERDHGQTGLLPPPGNSTGVAPPGSSMDALQTPPPGAMLPPMGGHHYGGPLQRLPPGPRPLRPLNKMGGSKENAIQVMTAECREYSRPGQMATNFNAPPPGDEPFFAEPDSYDYGYEPTQESQWSNNDNPSWVPSGIKELTPGPAALIPTTGPPMAGPPGVIGPPGPMGPVQPPQMGGPPPIRGPPPQMMGNMPPNMGMGPPPPHVMSLMMGPGGGPPVRMPPMGGPMMPPQQQHSNNPQSMPPNNKEHVEERRRNRSRSPHRSRRRSKSPSTRRSKSPSRPSKSHSRRSKSKSRRSKSPSSRRSKSPSSSSSSRREKERRSRSHSKSRKTRSRRSRSGSKSRSKSSRSHR